MNRRIVSILFLVGVMTIVSFVFYSYLLFRSNVSAVSIKYDRLQEEQISNYQKEEDRVHAINREIYEEVLEKFKELGGNPSDLSRFDSLRFITGGTPTN